ncbi:MAG TPA: hypothetical protein VM658_20770 [bacterium]|nr:hypothetical protein [bacterium]
MARRTMLFLSAFLLATLIATNSVAGDSRTLTRDSDPVIIKGDMAGALAGAKISGIRVFALRGGKFSPIPFQVDEKTRAGDFVFPNGEEKNPGDGDGLFNGNDELVLMARDLGDRADRVASLLPGYDSYTAIEISAHDPVDNGKAYAYAVHFSGNAPARSAVDYVSIDPGTSRITALNYTLGFSRDAPMAMDELRVTAAGGGDGVDYCDRLKARLHCRIAGVDIDKTEEDFTNELAAWIDGPVRVVRRTRSQLILIFHIPSPSAKLDNIYYYNSFSFPTEVYLPIDVGFAVKDARFRVSVDSPRLAGERRYRNSLYPEGVIQDGKMGELEKKMAADPRAFTWSSTGTVGPDGRDHGAWFNRLIVEGDNPEWKPRVFYIDDENHLDPPDLEPGSFGNGGYQVSGLTSLTAGTYRLDSVMYSVPAFEPAMADQYLRILDHPLEIKLKEVTK